MSCSDQAFSALDGKKSDKSLRVCSRWLNKGFVHIAPSVSQFVLLFQKYIFFPSLRMLGIETSHGTHLRSMSYKKGNYVGGKQQKSAVRDNLSLTHQT